MCYFNYIYAIKKKTEIEPDTGICCITQTYLERAKTAFESKNNEDIFEFSPNFTSPQTLVYKPIAKRYFLTYFNNLFK